MCKPTITPFALSDRPANHINFIHKWLFIVTLAFAGTIDNTYAAHEGNLGKNSSASLQITLVIPETLNIQLSSNSLAGDNSIRKMCVLGRGINHYNLSVANSENVLTANNIPLQLFSRKLNSEKTIPMGSSKDKLILQAERSCEQPLALKISNSAEIRPDAHALHDNSIILNIGAE